MIRTALVLTLLCPVLLIGCSTFDAGKTETVLKLQQAWVDGKKIEYVSTDISDLSAARQNGVNYVPRLADAIPADGRKSLVERVYKFPKGEQISVFPSAPSPAGGANTDTTYSPLWRLVIVSWLKPERMRELKSEEELLELFHPDCKFTDDTVLTVAVADALMSGGNLASTMRQYRSR